MWAVYGFRQAATRRSGFSSGPAAAQAGTILFVGIATFSSVQRAIARRLATRPEVEAAYVFGSVAAERTRTDSDVDVAVLVNEAAVRPARRLRFRLDLMADLGAALHRRDVEVVILNEASALLAHRVLSRGRLVMERSRAVRVRFQVQTAARYLDLAPMIETHIHYTKKRARERTSVG